MIPGHNFTMVLIILHGVLILHNKVARGRNITTTGHTIITGGHSGKKYDTGCRMKVELYY